MNILLKSKEDAESHFGQQAVMAVNLLGMVNHGEKAFEFYTGDMDQGFAVTVGYFNGKGRYVAFAKRSGSVWGEADLRAALMQIGRYSNWTVKPNSDFFDYLEKQGTEVVAEATGWQTPKRHYAFAYVPNVAGEISLLPDKSALDQKFET
ncbi:MAG: hypothetical protein ACJ8KU_10860 [Chthoniobacterales bacterium]